MSVIPSPHRISVRRFTVGTVKDEFGNYPETYSDPIPWDVRSIDPISSREPGLQFRDMSTIVHVIQADKTAAVPGYRDRVIVDGKEYAVDGEPDDWTRGPWGNPAAGVTVYLKRVEG